MNLEYRTVICPYCNHKFMWQKVNQEGTSYYVYEDKQSAEICLSAKCPLCSNQMIVSQNKLMGINKNNKGYIKYGIRGI